MDRAVETVIRENKGAIFPGDVYVINAPYNGGTHLPDITVCTPVFNAAQRDILFWVASRGHHADVGGISPGSMSPNATTIEQEGVYIDNFKLVDRGEFREQALYALLKGAKYPARNPLQNVNDIKAQIAANEKGVQELQKMVAQFTLPVVEAYMQHVQDNAAESVRRVIDRLHDSRSTTRWTRHLDQGEDHGRQGKARGDRRLHRHLAAAADQFQRARAGDARGRALRVPRHGRRRHPDERRLPAADQHRHPEAIDADAEYPAAVVAGNVETSQAVTNCLFGALGRSPPRRAP
jgi:5-oxoprolinase (ATP-hydrolysing)